MAHSCFFHTLCCMAAEAERAAAGSEAMDSVLSQLFGLSAGMADIARDQRESSICEVIYNLGNAASPPETRMGSFLPETGRFVEVSELGAAGGHCVVTKARDSVTGEIVAVKTLLSKQLNSDDEDDEEEAVLKLPHRALREACFMAACRGHPSIVSLSAIGRDPESSSYFLVMEYVGPSLYNVLVGQRGGKPFPERDVRRMMRQVVSGAKAMHDRGVVHRTIHSDNILVGGDGAVKIADFREATSVSETDVPYAGIVSHWAPEYLLDAPGAVNSELVDSWSMGCLMLELLTGVDHFHVDEAYNDDDLEAQLYRIFHVLGVPGKATMKAIKPLYCDHELAEKVQEWQARQRRVGKQQRSRLRDLVPCEVLSDDGFEVLQGLLVINPKKRLTAAAALHLPWFASKDDSPAGHRRVGIVPLISSCLSSFVRWLFGARDG